MNLVQVIHEGLIARGLSMIDDFLPADIRRSLMDPHDAYYPNGAQYAKHLDRFNDDDSRYLSSVVYLSEDWQASDGGELRLYQEGNRGRLLTFLSGTIFHKVLETRRTRYSVTGWVKNFTVQNNPLALYL